MLLNEFLKEHHRVEELRAALSQQRKEFEALVARLNGQEARLQKVSAQVEAYKPAPQMLAQNQ
jgi:phage shock protein A